MSPTAAKKPIAATESTLVVAQRDAVAAARRYFTKIDAIYDDPTMSFSEILTISTGAQESFDRRNVAHFRDVGWRQIGGQSVAKIVPGVANLANHPKSPANPTFPTVQVSSCNDVSTIGGVDPAGNSIIPQGRPKYLVNHLTITDIGYPATPIWRVSDNRNEEARTCP